MFDNRIGRGISSLAGPASRRRRRRGVASVLAMLYLVIFATLAVGFAEASVMSAQIGKNERALLRARVAAESGIQFIRYQLGSITVPAGTTQPQLMDAMAQQLGPALNGTTNMNGHSVANSGGTIYIPSASDWTTIDNSTLARFRLTIAQIPNTYTLVVTSVGCGSDAAICRGIQIQFNQAPVYGTIFNYGVASKGEVSSSAPLTVTGATDPTRGSVLVASAGSTAISNSGNTSSISGDLYYTNPNEQLREHDRGRLRVKQLQLLTARAPGHGVAAVPDDRQQRLPAVLHQHVQR